MNREELLSLIKKSAGGDLLPWEEHYLNYHSRRFLDTLKILGPGAGKTLLDVGAFPGYLTLAAHHLGYKVWALTGRAKSIPSLRLIGDRLEKAGIPLALADVEDEPFPFFDESFDVVLASEIIEHLHFNPYRMLRESFRVLKGGGRILITTPNLNRLENILALMRGKTVHSDLAGRFDETFSSILSARHVREYTASELAYLLEGQNKEMYAFDQVRIHYSKCLDPPFAASFPARCLDRLFPRFRSTLMVEAVRPTHIKRVPPEEIGPTEGFHPLEEHRENMEGIARMLTVPFRWMSGSGKISLPAGRAPYQIYHFHLVYLVPESFPPGWWSVQVKNRPLTRFTLPADRMFSRVKLVLQAEDAEEGFFPLSFNGPSWRPAGHGQNEPYEFSTDDPRELGVVWGWDGFLREDLEDKKALIEASRREIRLLEQYGRFNPRVHWRRKRHSFDDPLSPVMPLYLIQAPLRTALIMGSKDWRHLGGGWYFPEPWECGWVRWTGRTAEVFLSAAPRHHRIILRIFTGDPSLGERISGILQLKYSADRLSFLPFTQTTFDVPAGIWTDLTIPFPHPLPGPSLLHLFIQVNESRIPALSRTGSEDRRELGVAVKGVAVC
jgi:2-polyprenyl-3-methyl-5-hydroxy-6-metoxy-1,4-benzoquinol methylase